MIGIIRFQTLTTYPNSSSKTMMCSGLPTMTEFSGHVTNMCSHVYVETATQQWICKNSSPHHSCLRVKFVFVFRFQMVEYFLPYAMNI